MRATLRSIADDSAYTSVLGFVSMPTDEPPANETPSGFGRLLVRAVVPSRFKDRQALARALEVTWPTVDGWAKGTRVPQWQQVEKLASLLGMTGVEFVANELAGSTTRGAPCVADHPEWDAAVARAKVKYRNRVPDVGYVLGGKTSGAHVPEHIDEDFAYDLAQFWLKHTPDTALADADTALGAAELHAQRAKRRSP